MFNIKEQNFSKSNKQVKKKGQTKEKKKVTEQVLSGLGDVGGFVKLDRIRFVEAFPTVVPFVSAMSEIKVACVFSYGEKKKLGIII